MTQIGVDSTRSGSDGKVPGAASRARMSELVEGKGAINLLEYKPLFVEEFGDMVRAQKRFEGWACRLKDNLISKSGIDLRPYQKEFSDKIIKSIVRNDGSMFLAEWARQCIDKDSIILDTDGSATRIKDQDRAWKTGVKDAYEITVEGGYQLTATDNHPFWSPEEDEFVELGTLSEGDLVGVTDGIDNQWLDRDVFTTTYDKFVNVHRTDTVKVTEFVDADLMRFLGLMIADGTGYEEDTDQSVKFTNTNRDYCEWVAEFATDRWGVDPQWYEKGNAWDVILSTRDNGCTNPVNEAFRSFDLDDGFPTAVFETNEEMVGEFLAGLWAGDGYISTYEYKSREKDHPRINIGLASGNDEVFARYVQQLLQKVGVEARVKSEVFKTTTDGESFYRVLASGSYGKNRILDIMPPVPGKEDAHQKASDALGEGRGRRVYGEHTEPTGEHIVYRRVTDITYVGEREVYDTRYPGKDWFICQGFVVHNSGKTETLASTAYAIAVLFAPMRIGIFGPKQRQAALMWNRVKERFNADLLNSVGLEVEKYGGNTFKMSSGSSVHAITCGSGNIEGETFDIILIDETQKISRRMILSEIWPMGAETNATKVIIGTPHFTDCWFREQVDRLADTPYGMVYDWRTAAKYSKNYRQSIKSQLEQMNPESEEFRTQYELEWVLEEGMFLTESDWTRMCPQPMMAPYISRSGMENNPAEASKWLVRGGLDLAKTQDSTVLTITGKYGGSWAPYHDDLGEETIILLDVVELQNVEYPDQFDIIQETLDKWRADSVGVDSTGVGDPVTDILKRKLDQHVEGFRFSGQSKHDLYKHTERKIKVEEERDLCNYVIPKKVRQQDRLEVPMRRMKNQWLSLKKDYNGSLMTVESDDDGHDDYPDSASLGMWACDANYSESDKRNTSSSPFLGTTRASRM